MEKQKEVKDEKYYEELSKKFKAKYDELKKKSGSHSPSFLKIKAEVPGINVDIDCCFLSNPYATNIFLKRLKERLGDDKWLFPRVESYPAQNCQIAEDVGKAFGIKAENIFIGNGSTEGISAILNRYVKGKIVIILPTFSPYYEFVNKETTTIHYYPLIKQKDEFSCNLENLLNYCKVNQINNIVFINPNNPDGSLIPKNVMKEYLKKFSFMDNIILDESFIEFAGTPESVMDSFYEFDNLTIVRSMSKIFGIAGIRAGFIVTKASYVKELLETGYLWNSNFLAVYFFELLNDADFMKEYEEAKKKYNVVLKEYGENLQKCNNKIKIYKSSANFFLGELIDENKTVEDLTLYLLCRHGIYIRNCADKKGLSDRYFRISCRTKEENDKVIEAMKEFK